MLGFRENCVGFVGDIRKMYNSVAITLLDQHCHRFLWRNMKVSKKPATCVMTVVSLGDRPAGTIATVALRKTADMEMKNFPREAEIIQKSSYVDDIIDSTPDRDDASLLTCNIEVILKKVNFHIKGWTLCGCAEVNNEKPIMPEEWERVLGLVWLPSNNKFTFNVKIKRAS